MSDDNPRPPVGTRHQRVGWETPAGLDETLIRAVVGLHFLCHGLASLLGILGGSRGTGEAVPLGEWPGWWAALIQAVCGGLVLVGLLTRPAARPSPPPSSPGSAANSSRAASPMNSMAKCASSWWE